MKKWLTLMFCILLIGCQTTSQHIDIKLSKAKTIDLNLQQLDHPGFAYLFNANQDLVYADDDCFVYKQNSATSSSLYYVDLANMIPVLIAHGIALEEAPTPIYQAFSMESDAFYFTTFQASLTPSQRQGSANETHDGYQIMRWEKQTGTLTVVLRDAILTSVNQNKLYAASIQDKGFVDYFELNLDTNQKTIIQTFESSPSSIQGSSGTGIVSYVKHNAVYVDVYEQTSHYQHYRIDDQDVLVNVFRHDLFIEQYVLGRVYDYEMSTNQLYVGRHTGVDLDAMYVTTHLMPDKVIIIDYQNKVVYEVKKQLT